MMPAILQSLFFVANAIGGHVTADLGPCPAMDSTAPAALTTHVTAPVLNGFTELDRAIHVGCASRPMLRAWSEGRRRLAPYREEPAPDWLERAASDAARLPAVTPSRHCPWPGTADDWKNLGPSTVAGRVNSLAIDPRDESVVYAAAASGGVWKTTDGGDSWEVKTDRLSSISSGAILLDPSAPDTIWFGTGEGPPVISEFTPGSGIFRSTDGGDNWRHMGEPESRQVMRLARLPGSPPVMFIAGNRGIERSTDDGETWQVVLAGSASDVAADPGSESNVWAALGNIFGRETNGVFRSTDRGATWTKSAGGAPAGLGSGRITLAVSPVDPAVVWAGVQDATETGWLGLLGLWRTTDAGVSWKKLQNAPDYCSYPPPYDMYRQCWYNNALLAHPARKDGLFLGGITLYRTLDGGSSFLALTNYATSNVHTDQHAFAAAPSGALWAGNDGGVWKSTDDGRTWADRGQGVVSTQFYGLASFPGREDLLFGGLQDNGSLRRRGDPPEWRFVLGGDGGPSAIDPRNANVLYGQSWSLDVFKSTNGGNSWVPATTGISSAERSSYRTQFIAPLVMDSANPSTLLAATWRVWKTIDGAANWTPVSPDLASDAIYDGVSAISFGAARDPSLWAGTSNGRVWVSRTGDFDGWTELTNAQLPAGRFIDRIAVDPSNANRIWIGYGAADAANVYRSTDGGSTWSEPGAGLPKAPVFAFVIDPADGRRVWVGTQVGLFYSENDGAGWARWGTKFPAVRVDNIVFDPILHRLRLGTHGRGVWEVSSDSQPANCNPSKPGE